jgi:quinol monooxygenase YgiN
LLDGLQPSTVDAIHDALSDLDRSDLDAAEARDDWRRACTSEPGRCYQPAAPGTLDVPDHGESAEPIETLILRRGSTRLMARRTVPSVALIWVLSAATRPVPADAIAAGHTLLTHELAIQGVEGQAPGLYRWVAGTLAHRKASAEIEARDLATYLCLGQPLGGDSAYTVFESADLHAVLDTLGPRGYRAAHLEAGIVNGRLLLASHALGQGATGLTFFDDEVRAAFATHASCLLVTAVGAPHLPGHPRRPARPPDGAHPLRDPDGPPRRSLPPGGLADRQSDRPLRRASARPSAWSSISPSAPVTSVSSTTSSPRPWAEIEQHEPGTLLYVTHTVDNDPQTRIFCELFRDRAAFEAHEEQPHVRQFLSERERLVEHFEVDRLTPHAHVEWGSRGRDDTDSRRANG